jgi:hypothetical protein
MATRLGLTLIKQMEYRDKLDEEWSNHYWFTGSPPTDPPSWKTFADAIIAIEKTCYSQSSEVIRAYGYDSNDPKRFAVWSYDYLENGAAVPGTMTPSAGDKLFAGDQAGMLWWRTTRRNTRGKWIYLRKYMHDGYESSTDSDRLATATLGAYRAFVDAISTAPGIQGHVLTGEIIDEVFQAQDAGEFVTTRTLKRRGKRPATAQP